MKLLKFRKYLYSLKVIKLSMKYLMLKENIVALKLRNNQRVVL